MVPSHHSQASASWWHHTWFTCSVMTSHRGSHALWWHHTMVTCSVMTSHMVTCSVMTSHMVTCSVMTSHMVHMLCDDITHVHMLWWHHTWSHALWWHHTIATCSVMTSKSSSTHGHVPRPPWSCDEAWFFRTQLGDMYSRRKRNRHLLLLLVWVQLLLLQTVPPVGPEPVHRMKEIMSDKWMFMRPRNIPQHHPQLASTEEIPPGH